MQSFKVLKQYKMFQNFLSSSYNLVEKGCQTLKENNYVVVEAMDWLHIKLIVDYIQYRILEYDPIKFIILIICAQCCTSYSTAYR